MNIQITAFDFFVQSKIPSELHHVFYDKVQKKLTKIKDWEQEIANQILIEMYQDPQYTAQLVNFTHSDPKVEPEESTFDLMPESTNPIYPVDHQHTKTGYTFVMPGSLNEALEMLYGDTKNDREFQDYCKRYINPIHGF